MLNAFQQQHEKKLFSKCSHLPPLPPAPLSMRK